MDNKENLLSFLPLIKNLEIRHFTESILDAVPDVFWTIPSSKSHHPDDERGPEGNVIHSERVVKLVRVMAEGTQLSSDEIDCLTSAAMIHDGCRRGLFGNNEYTVPDHPSLIRQLASNHSITCGYDADIFSLIERHMGKWGEQPYWPEITPATILHMADMVSAHAEEVWPIQGKLKPTWEGSSPFQEIDISLEQMQLAEELARDNEYWQAACSFMKGLRNRKLSSLTDKQLNWLNNIRESLDKELDKQDNIAPESNYQNDNLNDDIPF